MGSMTTPPNSAGSGSTPKHPLPESADDTSDRSGSNLIPLGLLGLVAVLLTLGLVTDARWHWIPDPPEQAPVADVPTPTTESEPVTVELPSANEQIIEEDGAYPEVRISCALDGTTLIMRTPITFQAEGMTFGKSGGGSASAMANGCRRGVPIIMVRPPG
jgi:hypothetical protein